MTPDAIEAAIREAQRRCVRSDRDVSRAVEHFARWALPVCDGWGLTAEGWLDGGATTPTLAVRSVDGTAGVLKLDVPGALDDAARVMVAADGRGYARVLAWDEARGALLTERLGSALWAQAPTLAEQVPLVTSLLADAWQVPRACGRAIDGKAASLLAIVTELGPRYGADHPDVLAQAARYAADLARSERPEVVCHGDPHAGNVLRRGQGWALIDPDGFLGEREYDLGVVIRDACTELTSAETSTTGSGREWLWSQCEHLAERAGVEAERVWRWGFVERVTTGLYLRWHGHATSSDAFLATAQIVAP